MDEFVVVLLSKYGLVTGFWLTSGLIDRLIYLQFLEVNIMNVASCFEYEKLIRKLYNAPKLVEFGDLRSLTKGGPVGSAENNQGGGQPAKKSPTAP